METETNNFWECDRGLLSNTLKPNPSVGSFEGLIFTGLESTLPMFLRISTRKSLRKALQTKVQLGLPEMKIKKNWFISKVFTFKVHESSISVLETSESDRSLISCSKTNIISFNATFCQYLRRNNFRMRYLLLIVIESFHNKLVIKGKWATQGLIAA